MQGPRTCLVVRFFLGGSWPRLVFHLHWLRPVPASGHKHLDCAVVFADCIAGLVETHSGLSTSIHLRISLLDQFGSDIHARNTNGLFQDLLASRHDASGVHAVGSTAGCWSKLVLHQRFHVLHRPMPVLLLDTQYHLRLLFGCTERSQHQLSPSAREGPQHFVEVADVGEIGEKDEDREEKKRQRPLPHTNDIRRCHFEDEQEPEICEDGKESSDCEDGSVLDLPALARRQSNYTDRCDDEEIEGCAADDGGRAESSTEHFVLDELDHAEQDLRCAGSQGHERQV
mmetsp:Transcript_81474/g.174510  ORF Transcript_81474/g.174510 Transcript_81474/m.174510 type:complete len:285 (-) Transcript_81474:406-1260(-)